MEVMTRIGTATTVKEGAQGAHHQILNWLHSSVAQEDAHVKSVLAPSSENLFTAKLEHLKHQKVAFLSEKSKASFYG